MESLKNNHIEELYLARFTPKQLLDKYSVWYILVREYFQQYVGEGYTVLDVGAGYCEFINNIKCYEKIALDINKDIKKFAYSDVRVVLNSCTNMKNIKTNSVDLVFISNLLEHLHDPHEIEATLQESERVLKPLGKLLILQPNIKYAYREYWDYFDHVVPLSHNSTCEALIKSGFKVIKLIPKFLPYSTKNKVPKYDFIIRYYLKSKLLQQIFGKQMFIVAEKKIDTKV